MSSEENDNDSIKNKDNAVEKKRRIFLKKAVYAAPTIVALGALMKPTKTNAFDGPPSDPNTNAWTQP